MFINAIRELSQRIITFWRRQIGTQVQPLLTTVRIIGLVLSAIALWLFAEIAEEVIQDETHAFDTSVLFAIQKLQQPWLTPIMVFITNIGDPTLLVSLCVIVSIGLVVRKQKSEAMTVAIAAFGALGLNFLLKQLFERSRPALWSRVVDVRFYSFPSGHAMLSIVIYGILGYLLTTRYPNQRGWIVLGTSILIVLIGFSRLYLGVHWLTDVIAGYAAGFVWLMSCILSLEIWRYRRDLTTRERSDR
jgi:membrane-associated phospholipid phosphatase